MACPSTTDWLSAIGAVVQAIAALIAVPLAWFGARLWREQLRTTKQAEVAGATLVAILRFLPVLSRMSAPYRTAENQTVEVDKRWRGIVAEEEAFQLAIAHATPYLPEQGLEVLFEVWERRSTMNGNQWIWATYMDQGASEAAEHFRNAFGHHVGKELEDLKEKALAALKPLARVERGPSEVTGVTHQPP